MYETLSGLPVDSTLHSKFTSAPFTTLVGYERILAGLGGSEIQKIVSDQKFAIKEYIIQEAC